MNLFCDLSFDSLTDRHGSRNLSSPMKTNLHFSVSTSGVLSFDRAETVVEFSEWIDVPVKNQTKNETKATLQKQPDGSSDLEGNGRENSSRVEDGHSLEASNFTNANESSAQEVIMEKKLRKRTIRVPLKVFCEIKNLFRGLKCLALCTTKFF